MKKLKYPCHLCAKKNCKYREVIKGKDIMGGIFNYCDYGFIRKENTL